MRTSSRIRAADRAFSLGTAAAGGLVITLLVCVALFLVWQSIPVLTAEPGALTGTKDEFWSYVGPLIFGTLWASVLCLLMATPLAVGIALFITHYAPRRLAGLLAGVIDLLAAVPSVVFGLWGIVVLAPWVQPLYAWMSEYLGWIPLFSGTVSGTGRTILTAAVVLAVMVLPIMTALCREVFAQTPRGIREAALALGSTRWEMMTITVLPHSRSGIVSAVILGLGRALGETMAVAMVLSPAAVVSFMVLTSKNPNTIASNIALQFPESAGLELNTLIATGLVLFAITLAINVVARIIIRRTGRARGRVQ